MNSDNKKLIITSPSFEDGGYIPIKHTAFGGDVSPELRIEGLDPAVRSIAVTMDDLDVPVFFIVEFCHWLLWNLPPSGVVPEGIPAGSELPALGGALQGVAYGKNMYRGPKPPRFVKRRPHKYVFRVYALDTRLDLPATAQKAELMKAVSGHILQRGAISGLFKR